MIALVFSVAVAGNGEMLDPFVEKLKQQYPRVIVYDRNEEAARPPSDAPMPATPEVADVDAIFIATGSKETATIRAFGRHRFFNYDLNDNPAGSTRSELLLKQMVQTVGVLLEPPPQPAAEAESQPEVEDP